METTTTLIQILVVIIILLSGVICIFISHRIKRIRRVRNHIWSELLRDFGIALIVASVIISIVDIQLEKSIKHEILEATDKVVLDRLLYGRDKEIELIKSECIDDPFRQSNYKIKAVLKLDSSGQFVHYNWTATYDVENVSERGEIYQFKAKAISDYMDHLGASIDTSKIMFYEKGKQNKVTGSDKKQYYKEEHLADQEIRSFGPMGFDIDPGQFFSAHVEAQILDRRSGLIFYNFETITDGLDYEITFDSADFKVSASIMVVGADSLMLTPLNKGEAVKGVTTQHISTENVIFPKQGILITWNTVSK